ncbi:MAG: hypothetical protein IT162_10910 [Bryobacterales bacterium]|nr:hypothetical protein [Bryobacterales bacterium]
MKIAIPALLFCLAVSAADVSLTGKWKLHTSAAGRESDSTCTFTQKANELTGSCTGERGTVQINGKVEDKSVTWMYKTEYDGGPLTVVFKGKVDSATKLTGTLTAVEFGVDGEFTATQAAE